MYVYVFSNLEGFFNVIRKNYFPRWPKRAFTNRIIPWPMSFNNQRVYSCITLTSKQLPIYLLCTTQICTLFLSSRWICTSHNVLITQKMLASSDILDAGLCTKVQTRQQSSFIFVIRDRKVKMIPYYMYYIFYQFLTLNIFNQFNHDITEVTADIYYLSLNVSWLQQKKIRSLHPTKCHVLISCNIHGWTLHQLVKNIRSKPTHLENHYMKTECKQWTCNISVSGFVLSRVLKIA